MKGAEYAFTKVTEAEPGYADGWLNVARALIQEGETERAKPFIQKSLAVNPDLGRTYYFRALIEKADGDYDAALKDLAIVDAKYPRDRVVWNQVARLQFLKRNYKDSIAALKQGGGDRSRRFTDALHRHARVPRNWRHCVRRARTEALPALQGR